MTRLPAAKFVGDKGGIPQIRRHLSARSCVFLLMTETRTDSGDDLSLGGDDELIAAVRGGDALSPTGHCASLFTSRPPAGWRCSSPGRSEADDLVSEAFTKVLLLLRRGEGPDLAFRAYLLTAIRRLAHRPAPGPGSEETTDDLTPYDEGVPFTDTAVEGFEGEAAARAFHSLPERWQLVLWHVEVEGQRPAEVAPLLGVKANAVSALAYRAREGLREAYLTMHAPDACDAECRWVHEHLGGYVRDGLSERDTKRVRRTSTSASCAARATWSWPRSTPRSACCSVPWCSAVPRRRTSAAARLPVASASAPCWPRPRRRRAPCQDRGGRRHRQHRRRRHDHHGAGDPQRPARPRGRRLDGEPRTSQSRTLPSAGTSTRNADDKPPTARPRAPRRRRATGPAVQHHPTRSRRRRRRLAVRRRLAAGVAYDGHHGHDRQHRRQRQADQPVGRDDRRELGRRPACR